MFSNDVSTLIGLASLLLSAVGVYLALSSNAMLEKIHRFLRQSSQPPRTGN
jgi:hypothetical protein